MADVTLAIVTQVDSSAVILQQQIAAEAISVGELVYEDPTSGQYRVADCETSAVTASAVGWAMSTVAATNYFDIFQEGIFNCNSVLTEDVDYYLSVSGLMMPTTDRATNDWQTIAGWSISATQFYAKLVIKNKQYA